MKKPSVSLPESTLDEIKDRRDKGQNRSEYIREALQARFQAEDDGTWEPPADASGDSDAK